MLFIPYNSIVYNSSLHVGGVAFEVTPSDVEILEGKGQVILTEADQAKAPAEETSPAAKSAKSKARGDTHAKRASAPAQKRNKRD